MRSWKIFLTFLYLVLFSWTSCDYIKRNILFCVTVDVGPKDSVHVYPYICIFFVFVYFLSTMLSLFFRDYCISFAYRFLIAAPSTTSQSMAPPCAPTPSVPWLLWHPLSIFVAPLALLACLHLVYPPFSTMALPDLPYSPLLHCLPSFPWDGTSSMEFEFFF